MTDQNKKLKDMQKAIIHSFFQARWIFCLTLLPVALLLPAISQYPYPLMTSQYSDMVVSHFSNTYYLAESLSNWKTIPLWSSTILSGYPFAANPLSGIWYLPNWLAVIIPIPIAFNLLIILHLIGGGFGVYRLLRGEHLSEITALFGGLAFELMPKLFGHYGGGHIDLIFAVCWTPWLLVSVQYLGNLNQEQQRAIGFIKRIIVPAIVLSSVILADIRWLGFAVLLWISYMYMISGAVANYSIEGIFQKIKSCVRLVAAPALIATGFTAPFLLPFFEYVQLSTRRLLTASDNLVFSLPPTKLLGLVFPPFGDYFEWIVYPGIVIFILASLSWTSKKHSRFTYYWTLVFLITVVFALSAYLPGSSEWAKVPGLNLLRVPSRVLFISGIAVICLAGRSLEGLLEGVEGKNIQRIKLMVAAWIGFLILINIGAAWITGQWIKNLFWSLIFGSAGLIMIWGLIQGNLRGFWLISIIMISLVDLIAFDLSAFSPRPSQDVFDYGKEAVEFLASDKDLFRVYSPSYSIPQQMAVVKHIELADGVDPLQLINYVNFMQKASGVTSNEYSVTLPPFQTGNPATDNRDAQPDPGLLGLLNVKYVIADFNIAVNGLVQVISFDQARIYLNQLWLSRAWIQPLDSPIGEKIAPIESILWSPNRITISVSPVNEAQRLVLSEISYPGWQVLVDGKRRQIQEVHGLLRSVEIHPGDKNVAFIFKPTSLMVGLLLCVFTIILVTGILFYYGYRGKQ